VSQPILRLINRMTIDPLSRCWEVSYAKSAGYAIMGDGNGKTIRCHKLAYEFFVGPIPEGMVLDHLCRNKGCCNPEHLEPVTNAENMRRGLLGVLRVPDTCRRGHTLLDAYVTPAGVRRCKWCRKDQRTNWAR